ncbi:hypothetical protein BASA81_009640 [Batrachochytrium salamandrivorans]|nr:hypothetical protein BASA81_009640 [Batrachochytrium salamandrivorans]
MVALVQTLIAVMLIPVAFAAPAANGTTPASASKTSEAVEEWQVWQRNESQMSIRHLLLAIWLLWNYERALSR